MLQNHQSDLLKTQNHGVCLKTPKWLWDWMKETTFASKYMSVPDLRDVCIWPRFLSQSKADRIRCRPRRGRSRKSAMHLLTWCCLYFTPRPVRGQGTRRAVSLTAPHQGSHSSGTPPLVLIFFFFLNKKTIQAPLWIISFLIVSETSKWVSRLKTNESKSNVRRKKIILKTIEFDFDQMISVWIRGPYIFPKPERENQSPTKPGSRHSHYMGRFQNPMWFAVLPTRFWCFLGAE